MSHFSVLIIGDDHKSLLQPFHEFECTGMNDRYVEDIDITDEVREEYAATTRPMILTAEGELVYRYDDRFYRDPTPEETKSIGPLAGTGVGGGLSWTSKDWGDGHGYRTKVHFIPEGAQKRIPIPEPLAEWIKNYYGYHVVPYGSEPDFYQEHKYGYVLVDDKGEVTKVVKRTNPNAKWDWYRVGGLWSGMLRLKNGRNVDQAAKGDVDFETMRDEAGAEAAAEWDKAAAAHGGQVWEPWASIRKRVENSDEARKEYYAQPAVQALRKIFPNPFYSVDVYLTPREEFIQQARDSACTTFAVIKDGEWYERGKMGWWGIVSDEEEQDEWNRQFNALIDTLPDDTKLTVVDCHI